MTGYALHKMIGVPTLLRVLKAGAEMMGHGTNLSSCCRDTMGCGAEASEKKLKEKRVNSVDTREKKLERTFGGVTLVKQ